jgi:hypothetical protein
MAKKIQHEDLISKDVLQPTIDQAKALIKALDGVEDKMKDLVKATSKAATENKKFASSKDIEKQKKAAKELTEAEKILNKTREQKVKLAARIRTASEKEVQTNEKLKKLAQSRKKTLADLAILQDKQAGTLEKLAAKNRLLRKEREKLNLDTEKGRKRLQEINRELDKNNKRITENSDKLKKQRLNVGNYTNSIKEAAEASGLFGGVLGKLNQIQGVLNALLKKNTIEEEANTIAKETNAVATSQLTLAQRGLNTATNAGTKALRLFKVALASTGIGALIIAVGSLISFFTRTQSGVDAVSKSVAGLTAAFDVVIDRFSQIGGGIAKAVEGFLKFDFDLVKEGINEITTAFDGLGKEIQEETKLATQLEELIIKLTRQQKLFTAEQAKAITSTKELFLIVSDKLQADQARLDALEQISEIELNIAEKQLDLQEQALAASLDSISADKERLELGKEQLDFIERIKNGQIEAAEAVKLAADFTLSSAAGEEALFEIVEKIVAQESARQALLDKQTTIEKRRSALLVQIATKNSKALLAEAKVQQQIASDESKRLSERIAAIEKVRDLTIEAAEVRRDANIIAAKEATEIAIFEAKKAQDALDKLNETAKLQEIEDIEEIDQAEEDAIAEQIKRQKEKNAEIAKLNRERLQDSINTAQQISATFRQAINDEVNERNAAIDNEIRKREESIAFNQQLLAAGNADAADQLAFEQQQLAKAEIEKRQIAKREAAAKRAIQIVDAYFAAFERRTADPDTEVGQAGLAALGDVAKGVALSEVAKALAGASFAYEGTENVDGKQAIYDRKTKVDRYLYWLHPNERVLTDKQNAKIGSMSNDQLANLAQDYQNGNVKPYQFESRSYLSSINGMTDNAMTRLELMNLKTAVNANALMISSAINNKEVSSFDIDGMLNVVEVIKSKGKIERRTHKRF